MSMSAESDMLSLLAAGHSAGLVCECHDCTQARGLIRAGGLNAILEAMKHVVCAHQAGSLAEDMRNEKLHEQLGRIEAFAVAEQSRLEAQLCQWESDLTERLERIEQAQATLAGETMVLVLTKLLKLESQAVPKAVVGARLRHVAEQYGAGGHTHREKMLKALADEFDPEHKTTVAIAITDTKRSSSRKKRA
jgi:hypothetical protein